MIGTRVFTASNMAAFQSGVGVIWERVIRWPHTFPLTVLTVIALLAVRRYFYSAGYPAGWDVFSVIMPVEFFSSVGAPFSIYEETSLGQTVPLTLGHILAWIASIFDSAPITLKAAFAFNVWLLPIGMYALAYHWSGSRLAAAVASLIYLLSPQAVSKVATGQYYLGMAMAIYPILLLLLDKTLARPSAAKAASLAVLIAFLVLLRGDPLVYGALLLVSYTGWRLILPYEGKTRREQSKDILFVGSVAMPLVVLLTSFFWLPILMVGSPLAEKTFSIDTLTTTTLNLRHTLVGHSLMYSYFFWDGLFGLGFHAFLPSGLFRGFITLVPALAISGFIVSGKNVRLAYLGALAVVTIALALGPRWPMTDAHSFLLEHFAFLWSLHEPNRFLMLTWIAYAYGAGWLVGNYAELARIWARKLGLWPQMATAVTLLPALLVLPWLLAASPAVVYGYRVWQPQDWVLEPSQWLEENMGNGEKVLSVPFGYSRAFVTDGWLQHDPGGQMGNTLHGQRVVRSIGEPTREGALSRYLATLLGSGRTDAFAALSGMAGARYIVAQAYPPTQPFPSPSLFDALPVQQRWTYYQHDALADVPGLQVVWAGETPEAKLLVGPSWEGGSFADRTSPPPRDTIQLERPPVIRENQLWQPQVALVRRAVLVVGDLDSLEVLAQDPGFSFQDTVVLSVRDIILEGGLEALQSWVRRAERLLLVNNDLLRPSVALSGGIAPELPSVIEKTGWQQSSANTWGNWSTNDQHVLVARQPAELPATFALDDGQAEWELWADLRYAKDSGTLSVEYNGNQLGSVTPVTLGAQGFEWTKIGVLTSPASSKTLRLVLKAGPSPMGNVVAFRKLLLIPQGAVEESMSVVTQILHENQLPVAAYMNGGTLQRYVSSITSLDQLRVTRPLFTGQDIERWEASDEQVRVSFKSPEQNGASEVVFHMDTAPRQRAILAQARFPEPQDWRGGDFLSFWVKGQGTNDTLNFYIYFTGSGVNRVAYTWRDTSKEWRHVVIPLSTPNLFEGKVDWEAVKSVVLDNPSRALQGSVSLRDFGLLGVVKGHRAVWMPGRSYQVLVDAWVQPGGGTLELISESSSLKLSTDLFSGISYQPMVSNGTVDWVNPQPDTLRMTTGTQTIAGAQTDVITVARETEVSNPQLLTARFATPQDWQQARYLSFWVKGTGSGKTMNLYLYSQPLPNNRLIFSFNDTSTSWRRLLLPLMQPIKEEGAPDLTRVDRFVIDMPDRTIIGGFEFASFTLLSDELVSEEEALSGSLEVKESFLLKVAGDARVMGLKLLPPGESKLVGPVATDEGRSTVQFERQSPTQYRASIQSDGPGFVIFQNSYSSLWELRVGNQRLSPMPANFVTNVFPLEESYSGVAEIVFRGESTQRWALSSSLLGFIGAAFIVLRPGVWRNG